MSLIEFNTNPTDRQLRQFAGIVVPSGGLIVAALVWWRWDLRALSVLILAAAAVIAVSGLVRPAFARPIYRGWMYVSYPIGWAVGHVTILIVFFLVVTPIGLVMRAVGRDPLRRKFDATCASYWERRGASDRTRYFRQF